MKFGEKVFKARNELGLSRQRLAELTGIAVRTIAYYELENKLPKQRETYSRLADALHMDVLCLMDENVEFVLNAADEYGSRGKTQAQKLIDEIRGLYSGGSLCEEDMDAMMLAIQDAYWIAKKKNRKKQ